MAFYANLGLHLLIYSSVAVVSGATMTAWLLLVGVLFVWISVNDFLTWKIPDPASGLLVLVAAFGVAEIVLRDRNWAAVADQLLGAVVWPLLFLLVARTYRAWRGFTGLGMGDVKLMIGIGLLCGGSRTVYVVLAAATSAAIAILAFAALKRPSDIGPDRSVLQVAAPLGPFLCLSAWVVLLSGS